MSWRQAYISTLIALLVHFIVFIESDKGVSIYESNNVKKANIQHDTSLPLLASPTPPFHLLLHLISTLHRNLMHHIKSAFSACSKRVLSSSLIDHKLILPLYQIVSSSFRTTGISSPEGTFIVGILTIFQFSSLPIATQFDRVFFTVSVDVP